MNYTALQVRLIPTEEQAKLLRMHIGTRRYAYNFAKHYSETYYEEYGKSISTKDIAKYFRTLYDEIPWIKEVCKDVSNIAIDDYGDARKRSFDHFKNGYHTSYKSKNDTIQGFAVDARKLKFKGKVYLPKIGWISVNQTPKARLYKNPRVVFDGQYWYLSLVKPIEVTPEELTDEVLGVDLGLKSLAVTSNGQTFENINHTKRVRHLERKRKQAQRKMSRRYNKDERRQSNNYLKAKREHLRICRKLTNIRSNHLHQVSNALVKTKPKAIVLEDLGIKDLLKDDKRAKAIQDAAWYKLRTLITYKAQRRGIEVVIADRYFPSSQLCSCCHERFNATHQQRTWGLDIREWTCSVCGTHHDRDHNAALNLQWYYERNR